MDRQTGLSRLLWDLQSFLSVLDSENLSYLAQAQKKSISELLAKVHSPVEDAEYMIMSCTSSSLSNELAETPGSDPEAASSLRPPEESPASCLDNNTHSDAAAADDDEDEDTYEEAEPFFADSASTNTEAAETDSSHYESYSEEGEGEEPVKDRAHYVQWGGSQASLSPAPEPHSRLCGHLWRRRWLGQWSKQLFVIRDHILLSYRCVQDLLPQQQVDLMGAQVSYRESGGRLQHTLRLTARDASMVLGFTSLQHALLWGRVIEEVSGEEEKTQSTSSLVQSENPSSCRSSVELQDSDEVKHNNNQGVLNVLMNCQWQSLLCEVEAGLLKMFGEEEEQQVGGQRPPQYTLQLTGCQVAPGPDAQRPHRISLSLHGAPLAVLEASCADDKERWLQLLMDGAATQNHHDNSNQQDNTCGTFSGLAIQRFPASNMYMDDPFHLSGQAIYCNTSILEHMFHSSPDVTRDLPPARESVTYSNTVLRHDKNCEQRGVLKLDMTGGKRAESEINLSSAGRQNKRTSFRQSLAICSERVQAGLISPLLRRTASAKSTLKRAPSSFLLQHGRVGQRRKEWETKTTAS